METLSYVPIFAGCVVEAFTGAGACGKAIIAGIVRTLLNNTMARTHCFIRIPPAAVYTSRMNAAGRQLNSAETIGRRKLTECELDHIRCIAHKPLQMKKMPATTKGPPQPGGPLIFYCGAYTPITAQSSFTAAALFFSAASSSAVSLISMICSRPFAPSLQGTPM